MIDEEYVILASRAVQLNVPRERLSAVTTQLQRIEEVAQALEGAELDPFTDEMAPVWRP